MWRYALALVLVLVVVIGLGRWLGERRDARQNTPDVVTTPENSDYYLEDATLYQLGKDGALAYRAHTAQALHFPDEAARLQDITVHYVRGTATPWDVKANRARMPDE